MPRQGSSGMRAAAVAIVTAGLVIAGCAGPSRLRGGPAPPLPPKTPAGRDYLQQLSGEQQRLARAEQAIPRRARTPAALSHSIALLAAAIGMLEQGLKGIKPPDSVKALHVKLIGIMAGYHRRLATAARQARTREGELSAANALAAATNTASQDFTRTFSQITSRLTR